jgi:PhnO protein
MIRRTQPEDVDKVYRFICELENTTFDFDEFHHIFNQNINLPNYFYFSALQDDKIVGFISCHIWDLLHHCGPVGEIQEFFVRKEFRNMGIGRLLMHEVLSLSKEMNLHSLEVSFNRKRIENIKGYERMGFKLSHHKLTMKPNDFLNYKLK